MKMISSFLAITIMLGCNGTKDLRKGKIAETFAYVLPLPVEENIWDAIKSKSLENQNLFFVLHREKENYHLVITATKDIGKEYFGFFKVSNTNRAILINNKLFPIVFDTDYDFGTLLYEVKSLEKRRVKYMEDEYSIERGPYSINENSFGIKFTRNGEILNRN